MLNNGDDRHNAPKAHSLTPGERDRLRELHIERGEERQLASDLNMLAAVRLGAALQRHKEK